MVHHPVLIQIERETNVKTATVCLKNQINEFRKYASTQPTEQFLVLDIAAKGKTFPFGRTIFIRRLSLFFTQMCSYNRNKKECTFNKDLR